MRTYSFLVLVFVASFVWIGGDMFPQAARAESALRTASSPSSFQQSNQPDNRQVEIANLRADVQALDRKVREMSIGMEELMRRNQQLLAELERQRRQNDQLEDVVRRAELNRAISELDRKTQGASSEQRRQIIREVTAQIEELGKQSQAAIDALARNISSRPSTPAQPPRTTFSDDFPKEGISYTVQRGDTLSGIATRHNSSVRDIQNANQISNPASIQVGQTLFIPQKQN